MKKREPLQKKENVIFFPDLDKRLLEKGLDKLKQKKYRESIQLLNQAIQLNPESEDIHVGLVLANYEAGNYSEANGLAKNMLQTGIGNYFQVVDMYIMILVQQHKYSEIVMTVEALLEEKEVPSEKLEHFMKMLQFSRKMADSAPEQQEIMQQEPIKEFELDLYSVKDPGEQVHIAGRLASSNVRVYIQEIADFLASDTGDSFFKTMLLTVLKEQDYDKDVLVKKFARQVVIIPKELFDVHSHPDLLASSEFVVRILEHEDPILLDSIKQLMERYFFLLYPYRTEMGNPQTWAAAFHFVALAYFGQDQELLQIAELYGVEEKEVEMAVGLIEGIEEKSSS
jgi:tetratricopeptide (TPR) repeat protein